MNYCKTLLFCCLAVCMTMGQAAASPLYTTNVTGSAPFISGTNNGYGYDVNNVYDLVDPLRYYTVYMSALNTQGGIEAPGNAGIFIQFNFGEQVTLHSILYTDRTTQGGAGLNGVANLGTAAWVNSIEYEFSNDGSTWFGEIGPINRPIPGACGATCPDYTYFQTTTALNETAQYVRWYMATDAGAHAGAADFQFDGFAPEPSTSVLLGTGLLIGLVLVRRRRALQ